MLTLQFSTQLLLLVLTLAFYHCSSESVSKWEEHDVVKGVIDEVPSQVLEIYYPEAKKNVDLGNVLTPTMVRQQPRLIWKSEEGKLYTVMMVDPDAPSRDDPKMKQWRHWLVGNIPGNDLSQGDVLTAYVGAGPPKRTGLHRYIFLLFEQPERITFDETIVPNTSTNTRPKFCYKKFALKYNLGVPIAANFFQAKYDDYVPTLYKQLRE